MKAITVRPPWSQIIAETPALTVLGVAPKAVENRGRPIAGKHIGTDIAIHAGLTWCKVGEADLRVRTAWSIFGRAIRLREVNPLLAAIGDTRTGYVGGLFSHSDLWVERGAVVAVVRLVDCHKAITVPEMPGYPASTCCAPWGESDYNGKPAYHLVLDDVRRLGTPVPARGSLAMPWTLPDDVAAAVAEQFVAVPA